VLVLRRKAGESLIIEGNIRVTVLEIEGERVRLGIEAPRSVPVVRQELFDAVQT
jgi:carbon storage regulator